MTNGTVAASELDDDPKHATIRSAMHLLSLGCHWRQLWAASVFVNTGERSPSPVAPEVGRRWVTRNDALKLGYPVLGATGGGFGPPVSSRMSQQPVSDEEVPRQAVDRRQVRVCQFSIRGVPACTRPFPLGGLGGQSASHGVVVYVVDGGQHDSFRYSEGVASHSPGLRAKRATLGEMLV